MAPNMNDKMELLFYHFRTIIAVIIIIIDLSKHFLSFSIHFPFITKTDRYSLYSTIQKAAFQFWAIRITFFFDNEMI